MDYFGKVKNIASNYADKLLNDNSNKTTDNSEEIKFLKEKILKLEDTIRAMSQT